MSINSSLLLADLSEQEAAVSRSFGALDKKLAILKVDLQKQLQASDRSLQQYEESPACRNSGMSMTNLTTENGLGDNRFNSFKFEVLWQDIIAQQDHLEQHQWYVSDEEFSQRCHSKTEALALPSQQGEESSTVQQHRHLTAFAALQKEFINLGTADNNHSSPPETNDEEAEGTQASASTPASDGRKSALELLKASDNAVKTLYDSVTAANPSNESSTSTKPPTNLMPNADDFVLEELCDLRLERISTIGDFSGLNNLHSLQEYRKEVHQEVQNLQLARSTLREALPKDTTTAKAVQSQAERAMEEARSQFTNKKQELNTSLEKTNAAYEAEWDAITTHINRLCELGNERQRTIHLLIHEKQSFDEDIAYLERCNELCETYLAATEQVLKGTESELKCAEEVRTAANEFVDSANTTMSKTLAEYDDLLLPELLAYHAEIGYFGQQLLRQIVAGEAAIRSAEGQLEGMAAASKNMTKLTGVASGAHGSSGTPKKTAETFSTFYNNQREQLQSYISDQRCAVDAMQKRFNNALLKYQPIECDFLFARFPQKKELLRSQAELLHEYRHQLRNDALLAEEEERKSEIKKLRDEINNDTPSQIDVQSATAACHHQPPEIVEATSPARLRESYAERIRKTVNSNASTPVKQTAE